MTNTTTIELVFKARDDASAAMEHIAAGLGRMREQALGLGNLALGNMLGNLGMAGMDALVGGIKDFGAGLINANASAEQMHQTLTALYGTKTEADQAFDWMTKFALSAPFTRSSIIQAGVAVASFGNDITKVLPALGNVAAVMGQDMPTAAQAFNDALAGRFQMMNRDLHISKEALVQFGMQMNASGHVTNINSFVSAFEKLAQTRFGSGMSLQMTTLNGQLSNLEDQFQNLQRTMGAGLFNAVKGQLFELIGFLTTHQNQVNQFATIIGAALAEAARAFFAFAQLAISAVVPAANLVNAAWQGLRPVAVGVFGAIGTAISGFTAWFAGSALPVIETAIGAIAEWFSANGAKVKAAVTTIWNDVRAFGALLVSGLQDVWNFASANIKFFWDGAGTLFTLGQDAISGHWRQFGTDFVNGVKQLAGDTVQVFAAGLTGIVDLITRIAYSVLEAMVPVANNLLGPISWVAVQFRDIFDKLGDIIGAFVGLMAQAGINMGNLLLAPINKAIDAVNTARGWLTDIPGVSHIIGGSGWHHLSIDSKGTAATDAQQTITAWFHQHAPGLDKGQSYQSSQSVAQAQAAMEANRKALITPFDDFVTQMADKLQGMFDPTAKHNAAAKQNATKLGKELVTNLFSSFGSAAGGQTLDDWLRKMGISTTAGGANFGTLPGAAGLPVAGFSGSANTASLAAGGAGSAASGALHLPTGRVPLGALGAQFMQTMASANRFHVGTDPATRAAQQQVDGQQTQISQGQTHTQLLTRLAESADRQAARMDALLALMTRQGVPQPTPVSAAQSHGLARPSVR